MPDHTVGPTASPTATYIIIIMLIDLSGCVPWSRRVRPALDTRSTNNELTKKTKRLSLLVIARVLPPHTAHTMQSRAQCPPSDTMITTPTAHHKTHAPKRHSPTPHTDISTRTTHHAPQITMFGGIKLQNGRKLLRKQDWARRWRTGRAVTVISLACYQAYADEARRGQHRVVDQVVGLPPQKLEC